MGEAARRRRPTMVSVNGVGTAIFCRGFGLCVMFFSHFTLPFYVDRLQRTVLTFSYPPWSLLAPLGEPHSMGHLSLVQCALLACGGGLTLGLLPRICLVCTFALLLHVLALDRIIYNNHYVLMLELCALLLVVDRRCLSWPWPQLCGMARRSPSAWTPPCLLRWQRIALRLLVLTPYFYGALAKINCSWLVDGQPVRAWADPMLTRLDDASGGMITAAVDRSGAPAVVVLDSFARSVCWAGFVFDLLVPFTLMFGGRVVRLLSALAALVFHTCNKIWFDLGVFPYLCLLALLLFIDGPPAPPAAASTPLTSKSEPVAAHARRAANAAGRGAREADKGTSAETRRWPLTLLLVLTAAVPHCLLPLRHWAWHGSDVGHSSLWTDEGALYSWHMKLTERTGWLALRVVADDDRGDGEPRTWTLIPETDTALHPDQAGELPHNPTMLLAYATHLRQLFAARGVPRVSVYAHESCVAVNGRPPQRLYMQHVDLLAHAEWYTSARAALRGVTGVGRFLHRWGDAEVRCALEPSTDAESIQRASDATFRWLYSDLFTRPTKADWPWHGRSRVPYTAPREGGREEQEGSRWAACEAGLQGAFAASAADQEAVDDGLVPSWATSSSFIHAYEAVWTPVDQPSSASG